MNGLLKLSALAVLLTTTACQTLTTEQIATRADADLIREICSRAWTPIEYNSRLDTPLTVEQVREANRARAAFCKERDK